MRSTKHNEIHILDDDDENDSDIPELEILSTPDVTMNNNPHPRTCVRDHVGNTDLGSSGFMSAGSLLEMKADGVESPPILPFEGPLPQVSTKGAGLSTGKVFKADVDIATSRRENDKSPVISIHSSNSGGANRQADMSVDMNKDMEYITQTPMPKFEKKFRKEIIRPLSNLFNSDMETSQNQEQEEILQCVRVKVFMVLQGMFLDVKERTFGYSSISLDQRNADENDVNNSLNLKEATSTFSKTDGEDLQYTASGMDHISGAECVFYDPEAERVCREKLIPQLIRILMRIGGKDMSLEFLSFPAEDLINSILLDFMRFIVKVLQLGVHSCRIGASERDIIQGEEHTLNNPDVNDEFVVTAPGKKRRRSEMEGTCAEAGRIFVTKPNAINVIGNELLNSLKALLATESCLEGHAQSRRTLRGENWHQVTEREATKKLLPFFYKGTIRDDTVTKASDQMITATAKCHREVYDVDKDITTSIAESVGEESASTKNPNKMVNILKTDEHDVNVPAEDHDFRRNEIFGRHCVRNVHFFTRSGGLENLMTLISMGLEDCEEIATDTLLAERVGTDCFKSTISIVLGISYFSSLGPPRPIRCDRDVLSQPTALPRQSILERYLNSIEVGLNITEQADIRIVLDIFSMMEDLILTDEVWVKHNDESTQTFQKTSKDSIRQNIFISPLDMTSTKLAELKISMLWRFLTGENKTNRKKRQLIIRPPLQCQILSLNELRSWLHFLENKIREFEIHNEVLTKSKPCGSENGDSKMVPIQKFETRQIEVQGASFPELTADSTKDRSGSIVNIDDSSSIEACCNNSDASIASFNPVQELSPESKIQNGNTGDDVESLSSGRTIEQDVQNVAAIPESSNMTNVAAMKKRLEFVLSLIGSSQYDFVNHLLTSGLHSELLKRVLPLIQFLVRHNCITKKGIKMLWDASGIIKRTNHSQHESVTSAILGIFVGLVNTKDCWNTKSKGLFDFISELLESTETEAVWTTQTIALLEAIVRRSFDLVILGAIDAFYDDSISADKGLDSDSMEYMKFKEVYLPVGFEVLWKLADGLFHGDSIVKEEITERAFAHLLAITEIILATPSDAEYGPHLPTVGKHTHPANSSNAERIVLHRLQSLLIERTFSALVDFKKECRTTNVRILHFILSKLPSRGRATPPPAGLKSLDVIFLEDLLQKYDLKDVLTKEMIQYAFDAKARIANYSDGDDFVSVNDKILVGHAYTHYNCVVFREGLFQCFIFRCSQIILASETLDRSMHVTDPSEYNKVNSSHKRSRNSSDTTTVEEEERISKRTCNSMDDRNQIIQAGCVGANEKHVFSSLLPTVSQISDIWSHYISAGLSSEAQDCILGLFHYLLCSRDLGNISCEYDIWREHLASKLYTLCRQIEPSCMSLAAYQLFIYCLGHVNAMEGIFSVVATPQSFQMSLSSDFLLGMYQGRTKKLPYLMSSIFPQDHRYIAGLTKYSIQGIELLWQIVLQNKNEDVAEMSMRYLATIYTYRIVRASGEDHHAQSKEQKSFINRCFRVLRTNEGSTEHLRTVKRVLCLVRLFVDSVYQSSKCGQDFIQSNISHGRASDIFNKRQVDDIIGENPSFLVHVNEVKGRRLTVECLYGRNTSIGFLRRCIKSQWAGYGDCRLIFNGAELKDDKGQLHSLGIGKDSTIHCVLRLSTEHVNIQGQPIHVIDATDEIPQSITASEVAIGEQNHDGVIIEKHSHTILNESMVKQEILANPGINELVDHKRLEVLFALLSAPYCTHEKISMEIRGLVWNLLQKLPSEIELERQVVSILKHNEFNLAKDCKWGALLPFPSTLLEVFHLLYALQAMEQYTLQSEVVIEEGRKREYDGKETSIVNQGEASQNNKSSTSSATSLILIDDDSSESQGDSNHLRDHEVDGISKGNEPPCDRKTALNNLRKNGGMIHLVRLLTHMDMGQMLPQSLVMTLGQSDHISLLIICSNKVVHLLLKLIQEDGEQNDEVDSTVDETIIQDDELMFQLVNHILKVISWSVTFQEKMIDNEDDDKVFVANQLFPSAESLVHISGSLTIQCLCLLEKLITFSEERKSFFLACFCGNSSKFGSNVETEILRNAIISSVIQSPTYEARSRAFSVFRELLQLHSNDSKRNANILGSNKKTLTNTLPKTFTLLASLLPFRSIGTKLIDVKKIPRFKVLFALFVKSMSTLWSAMEAGPKGRISDDIKHAIQNIGGSLTKRRNAPQISQIEDISKLLVWLLQDVISLLYSAHNEAEELYLVGNLSMIRNILNMLGTSDIKSLIANISVTDSTSMLKLLLVNCTFDTECQPEAIYPLTTRMEIMNLLKVLCQECNPNICLVLSELLRQMQHDSPRNDLIKTWSFDPSITTKSDTGLVGLRNQGATCYMNSLLQHLFHIPTFRDGILYGLGGAEVDEIGNENNEDGKVMFFELQKLFGNLLLSSRRDYNTIDLVQSIRGYDGRPIRPGEQQDVDEFFNLFTDRLESSLKGSSQQRLLQNVFGGQLSHLVTCKECGFSSERVEDFLSISLDVKGKKDISESLNAYIQGDLLDGSNQYLCTKCDAKRDSVKRCCIKTLPNVLICHLKRFEFDLEMLRKVKVNDRFQFPPKLDMRNYTKEGIDGSSHDELSWRTTKYYQYSLRGVLVHTGTADSGHYYSLCSIRNKESSMNTNIASCQDGDWFCFNDSNVTPFDVSALDSESFGGTVENNTRQTKTSRSKGLNGTKVFNAYLLIYDREDNLDFDEQVKNHPKYLGSSRKGRGNIDQNLWETEIMMKNNRFNMDSVIFSPQYKAFLADVCNLSKGSEKHPPCLKVIQLTTYHIIDICTHSSFKGTHIEAEFSKLCDWYENDIDACKWLVHLMTTSHQVWAETMLLRCPSIDGRQNFVRLMSTIFKVMAPIERKEYFISDPCDSSSGLSAFADTECEPDCDDDLILNEVAFTPISKQPRLGRICFWKSKSTLAKFIGRLMDLLDECSAFWRNFDQFFEILQAFAECGQEECIFLIRCGMILKLVDFYLGESSNVPRGSILRSPNYQNKREARCRKMGDRNRRPNFSPLLSLLSILAQSANVPDDDDIDISDSDSDVPENPNVQYLPSSSSRSSPFVNASAQNASGNCLYYLPRRDARTLSCEVFFEKVLSEKEPTLPKSNGDLTSTVSRLLSHLAFGNMDISSRMCSVAGKIIADKKADEASLSAASLISMIHISDHYMRDRITYALNSIMKGIEANIEFEKEIIMLLDTLIIELANSTNAGGDGPETEVLSHQYLVGKLDELTTIIDQNSSNTVKQKFFTTVRMLLPHPRKSATTDYHKSSDLLLSAYGGESLENCYRASADSMRKKNQLIGKTIPYTDIEIVKDRVFHVLSGKIDTANNAIKAQQSSRVYAITGRSTVMDTLSNATFSEYFLALRECLTGPQAERRLSECHDEWIFQFTKAIYPSFWKIEEGSRSKKRHEIDILKGEMMRLFERLIQLKPKQFLDAIACSSLGDSCAGEVLENHAIKIMDIYVTAKDNDVFNNTYTVHFYSILEALGDHDESFLEDILKHENFTWAISAFVLDQLPKFHGRLYIHLLRIATKYLRQNAGFRRKLYEKILDCSALFGHSNSTIDSGTLELLIEIFKADERFDITDDDDEDSVMISDDSDSYSCISSFVSSKTGGMSRLSIAVKVIFANISSNGNTSYLDMNCLFLCLSCMFEALQSLLPFQVKKVIYDLPELDDTNFVLTQIITQSEQEWNLDCSDMIAEVVDVSRKVQGVFLSIEGTAVNRQ